MAHIEVRCVCSKRPLLGVGGRDDDGNPFFHIKVFKQARVYGEVIVTAGSARVRCRECRRWFTVNLRREALDVREQRLPPRIANNLASNGCADRA